MISTPYFAPPPDLLFWHYVTRLGEMGILMPLAFIAVGWLALGAGRGGAALRWMAALAGAGLVTTLSKLAFIGWGYGSATLDFTGFSGHSLCAAGTLPMLAWTALMHRSPRTQRAGVAAGFALAALIAYSRLPVHAHSPSEALSGFALGCAVSAASLRGLLAPWRPAPAVPVWLPVLTLAGLSLQPVYAPPLQTHEMVTALALRLSGHARPYTREDLHRAAAAQRTSVL